MTMVKEVVRLFNGGELIVPQLPPDLEREESDIDFISFNDFLTHVYAYEHLCGKWGLVTTEIKEKNSHALQAGGELVSWHHCRRVDVLAEFVTASDRSATRVSLHMGLSGFLEKHNLTLSDLTG